MVAFKKSDNFRFSLFAPFPQVASSDVILLLVFHFQSGSEVIFSLGVLFSRGVPSFSICFHKDLISNHFFFDSFSK